MSEMSDITLKVCSANESDLSPLCRAEADIFSVPWTESSVYTAITDPLYKVLTAYDGNNFCAYLIASVCAGEAELQRIAVLPQYRRLGVASALIAAFFSECRNASVNTVYLEVRVSNIDAVSLYRRCGFTEYSRRRGYYSAPAEDALLMVCHLTID